MLEPWLAPTLSLRRFRLRQHLIATWPSSLLVSFSALCTLHSVTPFVISGRASSQSQRVLLSTQQRTGSCPGRHRQGVVELGTHRLLTPHPCLAFCPAAFRFVLLGSGGGHFSSLFNLLGGIGIPGSPTVRSGVQGALMAVEVPAQGSWRGPLGSGESTK